MTRMWFIMDRDKKILRLWISEDDIIKWARIVQEKNIPSRRIAEKVANITAEVLQEISPITGLTLDELNEFDVRCYLKKA